ncbi:MAG: DUF2461 domain-containing protein [Flavobacteriaceae bacterium]|jgi:uncharacterized protein (TIGR02453 family)
MQIINPDLFSFFSKLKQNNNRDWFQSNKAEFKLLEGQVKLFMKEIEQNLQIHDKIEKAKMFRIYRDVRFSKNKTPYKTHFGLAFHREKPALRGGYYLHLEPENSFLGVGFWAPEKEDLQRIRKELEIDAEEYRQIMDNKAFKKHWGSLSGEEVKTAPKGFSKEHPNIDLIKKKQHVFIKNFSDQEVLSSDFIRVIDTHFQNIRPFFDYMSHVLTTDLNGVSLLEE